MVATMVDGGARYIVDEESFKHFTVDARSSQYGRVAAERIASTLVHLPVQMKQAAASK